MWCAVPFLIAVPTVLFIVFDTFFDIMSCHVLFLSLRQPCRQMGDRDAHVLSTSLVVAEKHMRARNVDTGLCSVVFIHDDRFGIEVAAL